MLNGRARHSKLCGCGKRVPELGLGGAEGMLTQKNLNFRLSEIVFGAVNNAFVSC